MAGRLLLWKNDVEQIKGTFDAEGLQGLLELQAISFAATGNAKTGDGNKAGQGSIAVELPFSPAIADLQARLFHGKTLGTVTITEIEQKVDAGKKTWKKIREIKLTEAWMESMSHSWLGIPTTVSLRVQYRDFTFEYGDKISSFNRSEK